ncbi:MAG: DNA-3-methyladenine glycosylase [Oscillospiraceae bacterium]|nr:DNA-3-methyladenine glycosylase [Oscillospiraceae bacterium]
MARLEREFFLQDTVTAAQELLGRYLVRTDGGETMVCRITETEAYIGAIDKACHAYGGRRTRRTETLYAAPGTAYVYLIYGMYSCLNFVTGPEDVASAVLIRGCVPVHGADAAAQRRFGVKAAEMSAYQRKNFMNGPGKLCRGLSIDRGLNALPLGSDALYLAHDLPELGLARRPDRLAFHTGKRIGIDYAGEAVDFPWRFWLDE